MIYRQQRGCFVMGLAAIASLVSAVSVAAQTNDAYRVNARICHCESVSAPTCGNNGEAYIANCSTDQIVSKGGEWSRNGNRDPLNVFTNTRVLTQWSHIRRPSIDSVRAAAFDAMAAGAPSDNTVIRTEDGTFSTIVLPGTSARAAGTSHGQETNEMRVQEAARVFIGRRVVISTSNGEVSGRLRRVGADFFDVEYATGKTAIIPLTQVVTLKEQ